MSYKVVEIVASADASKRSYKDLFALLKDINLNHNVMMSLVLLKPLFLLLS